MGLIVILSSHLPHHRHSFFLLLRLTDLHQLVGDGRENFGGRCCLAVLAGHNAVSDHCLVSVDGDVFDGDLLLASATVLVECPVNPCNMRATWPYMPLNSLYILRYRGCSIRLSH